MLTKSQRERENVTREDRTEYLPRPFRKCAVRDTICDGTQQMQTILATNVVEGDRTRWKNRAVVIHVSLADAECTCIHVSQQFTIVHSSYTVRLSQGLAAEVTSADSTDRLRVAVSE